MKLFYREMGQGRPLVILHGLFGSSDNWLSIAKTLSEHYKVYLVDQRNHGQSPHDSEFNYAVLAEDLNTFLKDNNIENPLIIGHSMGGKAAMEFAVRYPQKWEKLIVVDIAPKAYKVHHDQILDGLNALNLATLTSRNEADEQLSKWVPEMGVRQFLLKNLARDNSGFVWKINLPIITQNIEIIGHGLSKRLEVEKPVLFIRGENSHYIKDEDFELIAQYFPSAKISTIANAGHWVHAEQPDEFISVVQNFIN